MPPWVRTDLLPYCKDKDDVAVSLTRRILSQLLNALQYRTYLKQATRKGNDKRIGIKSRRTLKNQRLSANFGETTTNINVAVSLCVLRQQGARIDGLPVSKQTGENKRVHHDPILLLTKKAQSSKRTLPVYPHSCTARVKKFVKVIP